MGNVGAKLLVQVKYNGTSTHPFTCISGSNVEGTIFLGVDHDTVSCSQLRVKILGHESATVAYTETERYTDHEGKSQTREITRHATQSCIFYNHDDCIFVFTQGQVSKGRYEFPFSVRLPDNLPSSYSGPSCYVRYTLEVRLDRPGMTHWDVTNTITIPVAKGVPRPDPHPLLMGPNNAAISFCCKSTGFISLGAMSTKPSLTPGEEVKLYYGIANNSHTKVKAVSVTIYEKLRLSADGYS